MRVCGGGACGGRALPRHGWWAPVAGQQRVQGASIKGAPPACVCPQLLPACTASTAWLCTAHADEVKSGNRPVSWGRQLQCRRRGEASPREACGYSSSPAHSTSTSGALPTQQQNSPSFITQDPNTRHAMAPHLVPINREFLREFYKNIPLAPTPPALHERQAEVEALCRELRLPGSTVPPPMACPTRIDECFCEWQHQSTGRSHGHATPAWTQAWSRLCCRRRGLCHMRWWCVRGILCSNCRDVLQKVVHALITMHNTRRP